MPRNISELLTLYDLIFFSFPLNDESFAREVIEKSTRLFGVQRLAVVLQTGDEYKCLVRWGFDEDKEIFACLEKNNPRSFFYPFEGEISGFAFFQQGQPLTNRQRRLYAIFGRRMEGVLKHKKAEEALKESEELFRYVVEAAPFPLAIIDEKGRYEYVNPKFTEMFGYTLKEIPNGKEWFNLAYPDPAYRREALVAWQEELLNLKKEPIRAREFRVRCKDGQEKEILFRYAQMQNGRFLLTYEDVTAQRRAARTLQSSEQLFRTIFHSVNDAIFIHDSEGRVLDVNDKMLQMYGLEDKEEARRYTIARDYSASSNPLQSLPYLWEKVLAGEPQLFEWKAKRPRDGSIFDVEVFLNSIVLDNQKVILATVRDISARKRQEEFLHNLFQHSPIGMYIVLEGVN